MNIKRALFFSIKELYSVLDEGVVIEFRRMIPTAGIKTCRGTKTRFLIYVRYPSTELDLEDEKLSIAHELTHASVIQKGLRGPKTKKAKIRRENQIEEHTQNFRGKEAFFMGLVRELIDRPNCGVVFHNSIFDGSGKTQCPFFHYYYKLAQGS